MEIFYIEDAVWVAVSTSKPYQLGVEFGLDRVGCAAAAAGSSSYPSLTFTSATVASAEVYIFLPFHSDNLKLTLGTIPSWGQLRPILGLATTKVRFKNHSNKVYH